MTRQILRAILAALGLFILTAQIVIYLLGQLVRMAVLLRIWVASRK